MIYRATRVNHDMWYCSLCNIDLGEISALSKENDHPACPYCHGLVEEKGTITVEIIEMEPIADRIDYRARILGRTSEQAVDRIFEIIARSLEDSPYSEYGEDIVHLLKVAFEPKAKTAYAEIARIIYENLNSAYPKFDPLGSRS
jgi:Zn-finger nucleic acid-binding protein